MKVYFRKSGGFAPVFLGFQIDTELQPGSETHELKKLISDSGIMDMTDKRAKGARDVYLYSWQIEDNGKEHSVTIDQISVPESVKPLLEYCLSRAKNMLPD